MALPGSKPSTQPARRRNRAVHDWTEIPDVPFTGPTPKLPATKPGDPSWPTATRVWWKSITQMPHCTLWSGADWQFALDSALVAAQFHRGDIKAATELRQREKVMGTTVDFRRDLRIRYVPAISEVERPAVKSLADYQKRGEK